MSIVVTGGTGPLGRGVVESLLRRGIDPGDLVTGGRKLDNVKDLADQGVRIRPIDYDDPAGLREALTGAERVLIVSGNEFGKRVRQHTNVAEAAQAAGAELVAYTSAPYAATTSMLLAAEHKGTEEALRALGVPFSFLRNSWYFENYTVQIPSYRQQGAITGAAGNGRISAAARADYADAAAAVLAGGEHAGRIYELGSDQSFSLPELAAELGLEYRDLPVADFQTLLTSTGMPAPVAEMFADVDRAISEGELFVETGDLTRLIGRPATTLHEALATV
jgi:NAD(P)H dehydrogenase (quinone)